MKTRFDFKLAVSVLFLFLLGGTAALSTFHKVDIADQVILGAFIVLLAGWVYKPVIQLPSKIKVAYDKLLNMSVNRMLLLLLFFSCALVFLHFTDRDGMYVDVPKVYGGDEEHYLIMLNSLVKDFDLELSNNYKNSKDGGYDAGILWRNRILDHHSVYVDKQAGKNLNFSSVVNVGPYLNKWEVVDIGVYGELYKYKERPHHPPGMSFVFSVLLFPLAGWKYFESAVILVLILISMVCFKYVCNMLRAIEGIDYKCANLSVIIILFGTPVLFYSTHYFKEMFLAFLLSAICWHYYFRNKGFLGGLITDVGLFTRYTFPIIVLPIFINAIQKNKWKQFFWFCAAFFFGVVALMVYNSYMYGGVFIISQIGDAKNILSNIVKTDYLRAAIVLVSAIIVLTLSFMIKVVRTPLMRILEKYGKVIGIIAAILLIWRFESIRLVLLDLKNGLLPFSPVLVFALIMIFDVRLWRDDRVAGVLGIVCAYFVIYSFNASGVGSAYANRLMVPIMPLLAIPMYFWIKQCRNKVVLVIYFAVAVYSIVINISAVVAREYYWHLSINECLRKIIDDVYIRYIAVGKY